jgi:hypothetical protein
MNLLLLIEFNGSLSSCQGKAANACTASLVTNAIEQDKWWVYVILILLRAIRRLSNDRMLHTRTKGEAVLLVLASIVCFFFFFFYCRLHACRVDYR